MTFYLMHGVAGSGKSTLIRECGLEEYSISPDNLRLEIAGTIIDENGIEVISQEKNQQVWYLVYKEINKRMMRGDEIIILDATNLGSLRSYRNMAKDFGYDLVVVDFKVPLEELLRRNTHENRGIAMIPEEVTKRMYKRKQTQSLKNYNVISPEEFRALFMGV